VWQLLYLPPEVEVFSSKTLTHEDFESIVVIVSSVADIYLAIFPERDPMQAIRIDMMSMAYE
jgi:ssDNA-specific exonuclease RecJ